MKRKQADKTISDANSFLLRKHIEKFVILSDEDWSLLVPHLTERFIRRHDFMIREGSIGREVGYILEGEMRHFYTYASEEKTTYFYFENTLVGPYYSCITGQPSRLSIEALSDTRLIVFPYSILKKLFTENLAWNTFGRVLAEYLGMGLEDRMVGLLTLSPEERYKELIHSNKKKILERIPQHLIANYLGITPVSLSRIRNRVTQKEG
jgi:CRP-like cAMP-binding protein